MRLQALHAIKCRRRTAPQQPHVHLAAELTNHSCLHAGLPGAAQGMVYPVLDAAAVLPEHRSINSRIPTAVAFENATQRRVEVIWLSYQGDAHHYHTLLPGASTVQ